MVIMEHQDQNELPDGVIISRLEHHLDQRGSLVEIYRDAWLGNTGQIVQWNLVRSQANVLRGFHVHATHSDYLLVVSGRLYLGLQDMRPSASTYGMACILYLEPTPQRVARIPPGVAHGFYFDRESIHVYGVTHYWNPEDELSCRWDDPQVRVPWPITEPPLLSDKDANACTYAAMASRLDNLMQTQPPER